MKEGRILRWFLALLRKERAELELDESRKRDSYESVCEKLKTGQKNKSTKKGK